MMWSGKWYTLERKDSIFVWGLGWKANECVCSLSKSQRNGIIDSKKIKLFHEIADTFDKAKVGWNKTSLLEFNGKDVKLMKIYGKVQAIFFEYMRRKSVKNIDIEIIKSEIIKTKEQLHYIANQIENKMFQEVRVDMVSKLKDFLKFLGNFGLELSYQYN